MNWNELALAFIHGPGLGFTAMVLGFFGLIAFLFGVSSANRRKDAIREGEETRRAQDLDLIKSQIARVVDDQKQIATNIETRPARPARRRNAVIEAETS